MRNHIRAADPDLFARHADESATPRLWNSLLCAVAGSLILAASGGAQAKAYIANSNGATNTVIDTIAVGAGPLSIGDFLTPGTVPVELTSFTIQ